jgi:hypothetical protein
MDTPDPMKVVDVWVGRYTHTHSERRELQMAFLDSSIARVQDVNCFP